MCDFCTTDEDGWGLKEFTKIKKLGVFGKQETSLCFLENKLLVSTNYDINIDANCSIEVKINYCPMCGRNLATE